MHPGDIMPLPREAHEEPVPLLRVGRCLSEVDWRSPRTFRRVGGAFTATGGFLGCLYLGCESRGLLFRLERAFGVTIYCDNAVGSRHFKIEVSIMWDCVEVCEGRAP